MKPYSRGPHYNDRRPPALAEPLETAGLVLWRDPTGTALCNLEQTVINSSPTGFEWGYSGSGPSDLALNVMDQGLQALGFAGRRSACYQGDCFDLARELAFDFREEFISRAPRGGTIIPWSLIKRWILAHAPDTAAFAAEMVADWPEGGASV